MTSRIALALTAALSMCAGAMGDTSILNETFDQYANQAAFDAVWVPTTAAEAPPYGVLIPGGSVATTPPNDNPPGLQGKAVNILSRGNSYAGAATAQMATLMPSATQSVRLSADFFDDAVGNKRDTVGLRNSGAENIVELGFWNDAGVDPTGGADPINGVQGAIENNYAYRLVLFDGVSAPLVQEPNWLFFPLDMALESTTDGDAIVTASDVGQGWHRYTATITPTSVTLTLDFYRDGKHNTADPSDVELAGVDSTVTWQITSSPVPFDALRIGGPSFVTSPKETVIDNVKLALIDVGPPPANNSDFNGDGVVDGADLLIWQRGFGLSNETGKSHGNANADMLVDGADLSVWKAHFGGLPALPATSVVPEPTSALLAVVIGIAAGLGGKRAT
jgi:hypothetical protein